MPSPEQPVDQGVNPVRSRAVRRQWRNTRDRSARTLPGRTTFAESFLKRAGGDAELADELRHEFYSQIARKLWDDRRNKPGEPGAAG